MIIERGYERTWMIEVIETCEPTDSTIHSLNVSFDN